MKAILLRLVVATASLSAIAVVLAFCETSSNGQAKQNAPKVREPYAVRHCVGCHGGDCQTLENYKNKDRRGANSAEFVLLNEYSTWKERDLHSKAFENIDPRKSKLAKQMEEALSKNEDRRKAGVKGAYKVIDACECLACHAVDRHWNPMNNQGPNIPFGFVNDGLEPRFLTADGVSCEACHGHAEDWFAPHVNSKWRLTDADEKAAKGMIHLRSPSVRAQTCVSCHIGDKNEGRFVTHEMYAAGHPPLQTFELATYCADQPVHYGPALENKELQILAKEKPVDFMKKNFQYRPGELYPVRELVDGSVAALRANVKLLAAEALGKRPGKLLDFAVLDCAACHHDLKYPSERQNRNKEALGHPLPKLQTELLEAVLSHAETACGTPLIFGVHVASLRNNLKMLRAAFDKQPFGNADSIQKLATKLAKDCNEVQKSLDDVIYDKANAQQLKEIIVKRINQFVEKKDGKTPLYLDHDNAQQLAWALLAIRSGLHPERKKSDDLVGARRELAGKVVLDLRLRNPSGSLLEPITGLAIKPSLLQQRFHLQFRDYESKCFVDAMTKWIELDRKNP